MNYEESKKLSDEIGQAKDILLTCHKNPDPDAIGSMLALYHVLQPTGKKIRAVCSGEELFDQINYLSGYGKIETGFDFGNPESLKADLMIAVDSSSIDRITGSSEISKIPLTLVVIDHHVTNTRFGKINIVDTKKASTAEMIFEIVNDCNLSIDRNAAESLMAGIVGDTGAFRYPGCTRRTFEIVEKLMDIGADKDLAIDKIYRNENYNVVKFWGEILSRMKFEEKGKYVWSAVPYSVYENSGKPKNARETAAGNFMQVVGETDFGFVAVEEDKDLTKVSFRSRTGFDTSKIALSLGGGGHIYASGVTIKGIPFNKAIDRILEAVEREIGGKSI